jgi:hypothetical protein
MACHQLISVCACNGAADSAASITANVPVATPVRTDLKDMNNFPP